MARARDLLMGFRGRAGFEQVELTTLRLLGTARVLAEFADGSGAESSEWSQELDEAVARATALEAPYELALSLTVRSELGLLVDRTRPLRAEGTADRAVVDHEHAEAIFDSLGVGQVVITRSSPVSGRPIVRDVQLTVETSRLGLGLDTWPRALPRSP
jgi:hypothetical protein